MDVAMKPLADQMTSFVRLGQLVDRQPPWRIDLFVPPTWRGSAAQTAWKAVSIESPRRSTQGPAAGSRYASRQLASKHRWVIATLLAKQANWSEPWPPAEQARAETQPKFAHATCSAWQPMPKRQAPIFYDF
jgi:hypothetical protein